MNDEKFKSLLADAREIVEKAISEGRPMTEDERNRSMNMVNEAKVQYLKFSVEYMNTMNTEYPYSFTDIQKKV